MTQPNAQSPTNAETLRRAELRYSLYRHANALGLVLAAWNLFDAIVLQVQLQVRYERLLTGGAWFAAPTVILVFFNYLPNRSFRGISRVVGMLLGVLMLLPVIIVFQQSLRQGISGHEFIAAGLCLTSSLCIIPTFLCYRLESTLEYLRTFHPPPPPNELDSFDLQKWDEAPKP